MPYLFRTLTALAWALWLGGLLALFIFVQTMFRQDRPTAVVAAPMLFNVFETYQLILAGAAVVSALGVLFTAKARSAIVLVLLFALCGGAGLFATRTITAKMNALREQGQSSSPEFRRLHGHSMIVYLGETAVLLVAGLLMPLAITTKPRTAPTTDAHTSESAR